MYNHFIQCGYAQNMTSSVGSACFGCDDFVNFCYFWTYDSVILVVN